MCRSKIYFESQEFTYSTTTEIIPSEHICTLNMPSLYNYTYEVDESSYEYVSNGGTK